MKYPKYIIHFHYVAIDTRERSTIVEIEKQICTTIMLITQLIFQPFYISKHNLLSQTINSISFSFIISSVRISHALHTNKKQAFFFSLALIKSLVTMDNLGKTTMMRFCCHLYGKRKLRQTKNLNLTCVHTMSIMSSPHICSHI